jgi:hypothetical protein
MHPTPIIEFTSSFTAETMGLTRSSNGGIGPLILNYCERHQVYMDTITYASLAVIPWSVAKSNQRPIVPETELAPLDLSYLGR